MTNLAAAVERVHESVKDAKKSIVTPHLVFAPTDAIEVILAEIDQRVSIEPTVWRIKNDMGEIIYTSLADDADWYLEKGCEVTPLFTRPPVAGLAELTDEQWGALFSTMEAARDMEQMRRRQLPAIAKAAREFLGQVE